MLENIPGVLGEALSGLKAGLEKTTSRADFPDVPETVTLSSPAFADGAGVSPPLAWSGLPAGTAALVLLVEDAGSPTPRPLVHLIAWSVPPEPAGLPEGALPGPGHAGTVAAVGRNSFLRAEWLPPDPPTGHGPHPYLFQIYALRQPLALAEAPGRGALIEAMRNQVLAKGILTGVYHRP
ncbi:hypothetical protein SAMN02799625_00852 [Methylobacterium sp. UNC300MFChir4.1]|uniref:YbhB/YbcL family Raf kinase inhibitor-like protein n=1 Tax=Methylobacterium sp. UNC300MFChir4.1 TaxID=1502747 RepID=UPI0008B0673A|nr:YbhB/YbcL family Raf kinase inhibitor-like protein [Methylobacterium sp. UNC300MFChir4.1]SEN16366.1 hypothetical protein SAMN02799625_00852 [Methylobacterium sp. UNC300MFChir4.1]